jgi:hypothetical protein
MLNTTSSAIASTAVSMANALSTRLLEKSPSIPLTFRVKNLLLPRRRSSLATQRSAKRKLTGARRRTTSDKFLTGRRTAPSLTGCRAGRDGERGWRTSPAGWQGPRQAPIRPGHRKLHPGDGTLAGWLIFRDRSRTACGRRDRARRPDAADPCCLRASPGDFLWTCRRLRRRRRGTREPVQAYRI